jgi:predicted GIY-YIG superfamily endonuclease
MLTHLDTDGEHHVYVLKLNDSGEIWYYVGESTQVAQRIATHISGSEQCKYMDVVEIVEVETVKHEKAMEREREKYIEVIRKKDTNNVLGGR